MTKSDGDDPALLFSEPPTARPQEDAQVRPRKPRWGWSILALLVVVPLLLTLAGALTSPPHVKGVPVGHLIYLEADEPSDHTAMLRGLRIMGPDGSSHQLLHETEPQDSDSGNREWISQPTVSPDGHWLAYEKQVITLQEEQQGVDNQLWVMSLTGSAPQPWMLLDLTKQKLKQFVGLAWTKDSRAVVFLNDNSSYAVTLKDSSLQGPRALSPSLTDLRLTPPISSTRDPRILADGSIVYIASLRGKDGRSILVRSPDASGSDPRVGIAAATIALSPDRRRIAFPHSPWIEVTSADIRQAAAPLAECRWGWSVFGKRHITALQWSPDGKYLAYSVSKPPFEDELFYMDLATGKCYQLPVRTGQTGWDWVP